MQPKGICQSAEAREAGLSLDLALAGRIKAGEQTGRSLALIHIDADAYESVLDALDTLYPCLSMYRNS